MADYKELLRRAISALPENNGAARRAVYEKARAALVGQLRAITPPLPARDITQHRLQLEDCIRLVEQEASEAVISLGREHALAPRPQPVPAAPPPTVQPPAEPLAPDPEVEAPAEPVRPEPQAAKTTSIEDIISQAETASAEPAPVEVVKTESVKVEARTFEEPTPDRREPPAMPAIVMRAEAAKSGPSSTITPFSEVRASEIGPRPVGFEPRRDMPQHAANSSVEPRLGGARTEPTMGSHALARQPAMAPDVDSEPVKVEAALSSVREVEVEPDPNEAQDVIERAIETLDREARGESSPQAAADKAHMAANDPVEDDDDAGFAEAPAERGGAGLTIFLVVFAILLAGAGGAGYWAWREGYVDLDQMFGRAQAPVTETAAETPPTTPTLDPAPANSDGAATGPGNTAPTAGADVGNAEISGLEIEDRLEPTPEPVQPTGAESMLPDIGAADPKSEERLPDAGAAALAANDPAASVDPAVLAGSQSLLLEASTDGSAGAVPFSGTVEWSEGVDDLGLPTIKGTASIPARNLGVDITIRKNSDPGLPASHLMELDFRVSDTFVGGTIANLPGILLKDQELVPGNALVGASARVVGNSFLFALSATPDELQRNLDLVQKSRWMDLAVIYGTGRNAIITLEKDDAAQALFDRVFTSWAK